MTRPTSAICADGGREAALPAAVAELLIEVVEDGFALYCCEPKAAPRALVACYEWADWVDLVTVRDFEHVITARAPKRGPRMDIFDPGVVVWAYEGPPEHAVRALLDLVHPAHHDAPTLGYPAPEGLRVPRTEQRPMTIQLPTPSRVDVREGHCQVDLDHDLLCWCKHKIWWSCLGGVFLIGGAECKVVTGVDDHSRFCVMATVVVRATGRAVCLAFAEALRRYGVPEEVLTDNGKQFTDRFGKGGEVLFDRICRDNAITHRLTEPASPTTTGKVERFHKTLRREFLDPAEPFENLLAAQAALDTWVISYNCDRPHQSLDMGYPADRFAPSQQPHEATEALLPLRLPATLTPAASPHDSTGAPSTTPAVDQALHPGTWID